MRSRRGANKPNSSVVPRINVKFANGMLSIDLPPRMQTFRLSTAK